MANQLKMAMVQAIIDFNAAPGIPCPSIKPSGKDS
jgi:hypothetical protein